MHLCRQHIMIRTKEPCGKRNAIRIRPPAAYSSSNKLNQRFYHQSIPKPQTTKKVNEKTNARIRSENTSGTAPPP